MLKKDKKESYLKGILLEKEWYKRSPAEVKEIIVSMPDSFEGILSELINLPVSSDKRTLWKVDYILMGKNKALLGLILKSEINNEESLVELVSTKEGNCLFSFGVLGIRKNGKITQIGVIKKQSFLSEIPELQPIQAFFPNFSSNTAFTIPETVHRELNKIFGAEMTISSFIDLGKVAPDNTLSWNKVSLFMAAVDTDKEVVVESGLIKFIPVKEISEAAKLFSNGILLSIVAKLLFLDII
jgi:hypothetical protein